MGEYRSQIKPLYGTRRNPLHWANQGLAGAWDMNEGSGLIAHNSSGNGNDGTLIGMAPMSPTSGWIPGPHGDALAFDGAYDYVDCGNSSVLDLINDFTVIAGINVSSLAIEFDFYMRGAANLDGWYARVSTTGKINLITNQAGVNQQTSSANGVVVLGLFYNIAITRKGAVARTYKDGVDITAVPGSHINPAPASRNAWIGRNFGSVNYGTGLISSVSIYNVARQPDEIAYLNTFPWCGYEDEKGMQDWLFNQNATAMQQIYRFYSIGAA